MWDYRWWWLSTHRRPSLVSSCYIRQFTKDCLQLYIQWFRCLMVLTFIGRHIDTCSSHKVTDTATHKIKQQSFYKKINIGPREMSQCQWVIILLEEHADLVPEPIWLFTNYFNSSSKGSYGLYLSGWILHTSCVQTYMQIKYAWILKIITVYIKN